jgi:transcriptional regulator GlxA family with amidase domain
LREDSVLFFLWIAFYQLATTRDSIDAITAACGYSNSNHPKNLFKKRFAMTMRDFRGTAIAICNPIHHV